MQMIELESFKMLGISLAIGLLIGLERGWHARDRGEGMRVAGVRAYGLISLLGGLWGILAQQIDPVVMGFVFLGLTSVLLLAYSNSALPVYMRRVRINTRLILKQNSLNNIN